ncbi:MAG: hypothetical protein IT534_08425, partial [Bauldia sp.]|nr:hypothetical protein [Bauldia sp.]
MTESPHPNPPHKGEGEARARRAGIRGAAHARGVIALLLGLATTVPAAAQEGTPTPQAAGVLRDYAVRALDDFIRPAIAGVAEAAATLDETLAAFCAAPAPDLRPAADEAFAAVVTAWAAVIALQIEPLAVDSRRERFFFWPDPRGITLRQVQAIVAARDPTAADPVSLAGKSAAIQGLGALEYLLFGSGSEALLA